MPLHLACENGHTEIAQLLIDNKAHINATDNNGDTPLHRACFHRNTLIVTELLKAGADINIMNTDGKTALYYIQNIDLATLLYIQGADIEDAHTNQSLYSIFKNINTFYTQHSPDSVSYNTLSTHIDENHLHIYIAQLCSKGLHKHAFRIITEKAKSENMTNADELRSYLIRYICTHITQFLLINPSRMETFVHDLYMYNNPHYKNDTLFMSTLIENERHIHNNLFIKKCTSILAQYMTHESLMSHLIKHMDPQDHDILISTLIDKHKDDINTLNNGDDFARDNQTDIDKDGVNTQDGDADSNSDKTDKKNQSMSLLEKAIRLNKTDVVRKLLQSEHINIDTMYNMFKASQFLTQLYALVSNYETYTQQDIQEKIALIIGTLQSINNNYFITLCANACGFKSDTTRTQFVSLLKKLTKTDDSLIGFKQPIVDIILPALKKSKLQKDSVLNMYGIHNAHMYARMICDTKHARDMASQIVRQVQQEPHMYTEDIARYIASYTRY
jgi:hypothetical protein